MITMLVTYAGDEQTPFDRDHWINVHFPLVRESWGPYGLVSAGGFFPQGDGAGRIALVSSTSAARPPRKRRSIRPRPPRSWLTSTSSPPSNRSAAS